MIDTFHLFFFLSLSTLLATVIISFIRKFGYKSHRLLTPYRILFGGTYVSAFLLFLPICLKQFSRLTPFSQRFGAILISAHHAIRLFAIDNDFAVILEGLAEKAIQPETYWLSVAYAVLGAVLYILSPLLTFGFILSFFKNMASYRRYFFSFGRTVHVFPSLNEHSMALAESIAAATEKTGVKKFLRDVIVFTDVIDGTSEEHYELMEKTRLLGAIVFRKDLESIRFSRRFFYRNSTLNFYLIEEDEAEKLRYASAIMKHYDSERNTLYIFSAAVQCRLLFEAKPNTSLRIIRVNDIRSLIYHNLDVYGIRLFHKARVYNDNVISAVIVGLGRYGTELLKALTWFCQVEGFKLKINAYEQKKNAEEHFTAACPELMAMNRNETPGEAHYDINIHSGVDVHSSTFHSELAKVKDATYVFVCLGTDDQNIAVSEQIRTLYAGLNDRFHPDIETVVYDTHLRKSMGYTWNAHGVLNEPRDAQADGVRNYKGQAYRIHMIGDLESFYSTDTVIDSPLVTSGLHIHLRYTVALAFQKARAAKGAPLTAEEERAIYASANPASINEFWQKEYCYRSSVAKALAENLRQRLSDAGYLKLLGSDTPWAERQFEERLAIGTVEHVRWNAYMRTEGYSQGPRDDLAKRHPNLVATSKLTASDLAKDA